MSTPLTFRLVTAGHARQGTSHRVQEVSFNGDLIGYLCRKVTRGASAYTIHDVAGDVLDTPDSIIAAHRSLQALAGL